MDSNAHNFNVAKPVEQTAPDGTKVMAYPAWYLILLWCMGHKIAPTYANSKHFNYAGMATQEELEDNIDDVDYIQDNLVFSFEAKKPLKEYDRDTYPKVIAKELLAEGKSIGTGEIYQFYKIKPVKYRDENGESKQKKFTIYANKYELDLDKYKEGLFNCVKKILDLFDLDVVAHSNRN